MRTRFVFLVAALAGGACLGLLLVRVCADGGAMGSAYRSCRCRGVEWELYDRTPADGPRRTVCLGWVESKTCHQFREGPVVPCPE
jgi:hypothetical protein